MEFYGKKKLQSYKEEDQNTVNSTSGLSFQQFQQESDPPLSPPRPSSVSTVPPSPESPWTLTPNHPTPSLPLLYQCIASLHRQDGNIYSIAALNGTVFTGSESSRIHVWRQPDCMERGYLKTSSVDARAILGYGNLLFTSHRDGKVRVWGVSFSENFQSKKIASIPRRSSFPFFSRNKNQQHKDCISCLAYYHAEGLLYTGSWDKRVKCWRVTDQRCLDTFVAHDDAINAIAVNQEDGRVFTCSSDGSIKLWRRVFSESSHSLTMTLKFQPCPVNAIALSSSMNSSYLYSGSSDGFINFWEKEKVSGRFNHGGVLQGHRFAVLCLAAIDKLVISGSEDTTIRVWRREEGNVHACLAVMNGHRGPVRCLAACLEMEKVVMGFLVYSASLDGTFKAWRVRIFPGEKKVGVENTGQFESRKKVMEYEMSPVLSPSWVAKKLQGNSMF